MLKLGRPSATLSLLACSVLAAQPEPFSFAGLNLKTTMAELKGRYPRSTALDTLVYLSDEESHDHIATIGLTSTGAVRTLTITFERQRGARATYPSCERSLSGLRERYGNPAHIVDAQEERAQNRRFQWNTSTESLTLHCFRMPRQPLYAERLTITSSRRAEENNYSLCDAGVASEVATAPLAGWRQGAIGPIRLAFVSPCGEAEARSWRASASRGMSRASEASRRPNTRTAQRRRCDSEASQ